MSKLIDRLKWFRFVLWRWYFTRYELPRLVNKSYDKLREGYRVYQKTAWENKHAAMSFQDWCGKYDV
jgi:hypothetical protein